MSRLPPNPTTPLPPSPPSPPLPLRNAPMPAPSHTPVARTQSRAAPRLISGSWHAAGHLGSARRAGRGRAPRRSAAPPPWSLRSPSTACGPPSPLLSIPPAPPPPPSRTQLCSLTTVALSATSVLSPAQLRVPPLPPEVPASGRRTARSPAGGPRRRLGRTTPPSSPRDRSTKF